MRHRTMIRSVVAVTLALTAAPSVSRAKGPLKPLPIGELSGSTDGNGTFRLGLGWRGSVSSGGEWDYVVSPSLAVSTKSGRATLISLTAEQSSVASDFNPGLSVMFIRTRTDASTGAMISM